MNDAITKLLPGEWYVDSTRAADGGYFIFLAHPERYSGAYVKVPTGVEPSAPLAKQIANELREACYG